MMLVWWAAVDPLAPYELARLGVPARPDAAWQLPAWYLAKLWYGVLVKRCRSEEDLDKLESQLGSGQTSEQEQSMRDLGFSDEQIALRRRLASASTPEERIRITLEARERAEARQRPVGR